MSGDEIFTRQCVMETPAPRKRTSSVASVSRLSSVKRRRISMLGDNIDMQTPNGAEKHSSNHLNLVDRFISSRPETAVPITLTPRSHRINQAFHGALGTRILNFKDNQENIPPSGRSETYRMLRRSASSLFDSPPALRSSSVTENLNKKKQCELMLDGPGIPLDPFTFPITWSKKNLIAVACGTKVFYQNLNTRVVSCLCKLNEGTPAELSTIEFAGAGQEHRLALGTDNGVVQIWDVHHESGIGTMLTSWRREDSCMGVGGMDWCGDLLAAGSHDGSLSLFDIRSRKGAGKSSVHKGRVLGVKYNLDGSMIASGDDLGMVYVWDKRAGKQLLEEGTQGSKMRHKGSVKAVAWCSWKPDLLATGSIYPEGKIHIWSSLSLTTMPTPIETLTLNTSVMSLHWSPHCKELLSTHGSSFQPASTSKRHSASSSRRSTEVKTVVTPLTNAIAVHGYPSCERLLTLSCAHLSAVTHSCLGPDGEDLFTVCPKEETIKKWHVWSKRTEAEKGESAFEKWSIR